MSAQRAHHLQQGCNFFFGQQIDLQIEVIAMFSTAHHAVLAHDDKAGKNDCFNSNNHSEQRKRPGIKWSQAGDAAGIYYEPRSHKCKMEHYKGNASREGSDAISETLRHRPAFESLFLLLHNRIYVSFGVSGMFRHPEGLLR